MSEWDQYKAKLANWIGRLKRYPVAAIRAQEEGTVWVKFRIDLQGIFHDWSLVQSSGSPTLDNEALCLIERASSYQPLPSLIQATSIELKVPVEFKLF